MLYVNRVKILAWKVVDDSYANAVTIQANHYWRYNGKVSNIEVSMILDRKEYIIPIMTFERCFLCLG